MTESSDAFVEFERVQKSYDGETLAAGIRAAGHRDARYLAAEEELAARIAGAPTRSAQKN